MEFKKSELSVIIYGTTYNVTKPTFAQSRAMGKKLKAEGDENSFDVLCEHLCGLGLPKEVIEGMEADHVLTLCEYLSPKKSP